MEAERHRSEEEHRTRMDAVEMQRAKMEQEKAALTRLQIEAARAVEDVSRRHKDKEAALQRVKEELRKEAAEFEDKVGVVAAAGGTASAYSTRWLRAPSTLFWG